MRNLINQIGLFIIVFTLSALGNVMNAQPPGLCSNIQNCNDENFSATEDDDTYAGEFYSSYEDDNFGLFTNVVHSEYIGADNYQHIRAYFGKAYPQDWWGVGARFEAGFCAIEAITISDGTDHTHEIPPGHQYPYYGTFTRASDGGPNSVHLPLFAVGGSLDPAALNYGVIGQTYGPGESYAGFFVGDVVVTGTLTEYSDRRLKKNEKALKGSLEKLSLLNAKSYQFNQDNYAHLNLPKGEQFGFIAQELEEVFPQLVKEATSPTIDPESRDPKAIKTERFKSVNYIGLIPILANAINEQTLIIEEKDQKINALEQQLSDLLERVEHIENALRINPEDKHSDIPSLKQNQPNPSGGQTSIQYNIPNHVKTAYIKVFTIAGQEIQSIPIQNRGMNTVEIDLLDAQAGSYFYSLIIDGSTVDTKKMLLSK